MIENIGMLSIYIYEVMAPRKRDRENMEELWTAK